MTPEQYQTLVDRLQLAFDKVVDSGSDDELFYAGYLNGHFSLAASQAELAGDISAAGLHRHMQASLAKARADNELEAQDFLAVERMWQSLFGAETANSH